MNCKIESMSDNRKNQVDTLPPRGRVNEVRREWLVHEDGALAYRLQDEEIKQHLTGNKSRNLQIREDFPTAKNEQMREAEQAAKLHQELLLQQEQQDAKIAAQLADFIEKEEEERKRILEEEDKELAKLLQEKEQRKIIRKERNLRELETHTPRKEKYYHDEKSYIFQKTIFDKNGRSSKAESTCSEISSSSSSNQNSFSASDNLSDINNVGLPLQDEIVQPLRNFNISNHPMFASTNDIISAGISEDEARRIQEAKDEEYARYLQEKENLENLDTVNKDRLLAIETQDKELARLLQEKERAKARRARERAKQKAALKKMKEKIMDEAEEETESITIKTAETVDVNNHRKSEGNLSNHREYTYPQPDLITRNPKQKPRYPDPEEIVELPEEKSSTPLSNIAMTIDPTYNKESLERNNKLKKGGVLRNSKSYENEEPTVVALPVEDLAKDGNAPPYMPIQGQRRLPERKSKQKDGCKQQ